MAAPAPAPRARLVALAGPAGALLLAAAAPAAEPQEGDAFARCLVEQGLPRVARVLSPEGRPGYARVIAATDGIPTAVAPLAPGEMPLAEVLALAAADRPPARGRPRKAWPIASDDLAARICAPLPLGQAEIESERQVVVAAGLNYAAHAEEAGGGDVFLFPKPAAPSPPYGEIPRHAGVALLDYEVELGFVLLEPIELAALPDEEALLEKVAFFVANDVSDREPIILQKALTGPGTGFVAAKGRLGFLPAGPWLVRGKELGAALFACGAEGLTLGLEVDEGQGFRSRQRASTEQMILEPRALLARLAEEVEREGLRTAMPLARGGRTRHYPLAVDAAAPRLPAGSVVLTGTPEGVALQAPETLPLVYRALAQWRSPFEQFRLEELARAGEGEPGGYLAPGHRVRARIGGLGAQLLTVSAPAGAEQAPPDPCTPEETP